MIYRARVLPNERFEAYARGNTGEEGGLMAVGGRFVQTKRGYALFDENGRYVGLIEAPGSTTAFGPSSPTTLLPR